MGSTGVLELLESLCGHIGVLIRLVTIAKTFTVPVWEISILHRAGAVRFHFNHGRRLSRRR